MNNGICEFCSDRNKTLEVTMEYHCIGCGKDMSALTHGVMRVIDTKDITDDQVLAQTFIGEVGSRDYTDL